MIYRGRYVCIKPTTERGKCYEPNTYAGHKSNYAMTRAVEAMKRHGEEQARDEQEA